MPNINEIVKAVKEHTPLPAVKKEADLEKEEELEAKIKTGLYRVLKVAESISSVYEVRGGA